MRLEKGGPFSQGRRKARFIPCGEMNLNPYLTPHSASQVRSKAAVDRENATTFRIVFCEELSSYRWDWEQFLTQGRKSSPGLGKN